MTLNYNSNYDGTTPFSDTCAQFALATGVEETYTVPGSETTRYQVLFKYNANSNVFIRLNATPTLPTSGNVTTQPNHEFKPYKRYAKGGDVIHAISPDTDTTYFGVSLMTID